MGKTSFQRAKKGLSGVALKRISLWQGVKVNGAAAVGLILMFNLLSCSKYVIVPDIKPETLLSKGLFYSDIRNIEVLKDSGRVAYRLKVK
jgi:hypothetical protein